MKRIIALGFSLLLFAGPVYASGNDISDVKRLATVLNAIGVRAVYDSSLCKENQNFFGVYHRVRKELHVCNRGDNAEQMDTLRHEAWHVLQDYTDCQVGDMQSRPFLNATQIEKAYWGQVDKYPDEVKHMEADAFKAAHRLSVRDITNLLIMKIRACHTN